MEFENQNNQETNETVETPVMDNTMDISALIKSSKETEPEKEKSALDKMLEAKDTAKGLVVDTKEIQEKNSVKPKQTKAMADAFDEIDEYTKQQDKLIDAAKNLNIKKPQSPEEMLTTIDMLDQVANNPDFVPPEQHQVDSSAVQSESEEIVDEDEEEISPEKAKIVNILIDKTGLGGDFMFTEEEKEKIFSASELRVKEVEEIDLASLNVKPASKSFIETVEEYQISTSKVPVVFPASRFRAYMTGLSYGEMGDISLNGENITFDQLHKKLTVIYSKMVNPSIGKFENFEDFLRKFSYLDIDLAVYGLVVATFPEVDDIPLVCNDPSCKKGFNHKFSPRTLIRFEKSDDKFLQAMQDVIDCKPADFDKLVQESPTRTHKIYKLPHSKFIVEVGVASSYDYLYDIVDNIIGDKFTKEHPDDVNGILQLNATLLSLVRSVYVPVEGAYQKYEKFNDIINALYHIKPEEFAILASLLQKYIESYSVVFELTDITCPHCGRVTKRIPIDINYLVFLKYQRLMNTEINLDSISIL